MGDPTMRTHVVLPDELVQEVDQLVGPRKRSEYLEAALREKLRRDRQRWAIKTGAGILKGSTPEYWSTPEKVSRWLDELRQVDIARSEEIWRNRKIE
jgi:Arc/MetJ-type ribon-helix-helix transcriptional regulator